MSREAPQNTAQKQYEALRAFYLEKQPAAEVAQRFGYTLSSFYTLTRDFKKQMQKGNPSEEYFVSVRRGSKPSFEGTQTQQLIIELRKKSLSVPDIKSILDTLGYCISERSISNILKQAGFTKLPRRNRNERSVSFCSLQLAAPASHMLGYEPEVFRSSKGLGIVCLLPYLQESGMMQRLESSDYPETQTLNRRCSLLSFVALKLSKVRRYSADDI